MATKKSETKSDGAETTEAPAPNVTFETIAVDLLNALVDTGGRESPMHDIVLRALKRVAALAVEAEG